MTDNLASEAYAGETGYIRSAMNNLESGITGFLGMAEKGPVEGPPVLVTDFVEFQQVYGGYLSASDYGPHRFLAYAVENYFANGGTEAYIVRVEPDFCMDRAYDVCFITDDDYIGEDRGPGRSTGLQAFLYNDRISILTVPGVTMPMVHLALVEQCERLENRFAVLDLPRDAESAEQILEFRSRFCSSYAALYHPWLTVYDPLDQSETLIPPSGSVAGVYARCDQIKGVHGSSAKEAVHSCLGTALQFSREEREVLKDQGVNLISEIPGMGIRICSSRTASLYRMWRSINVRRLSIFIRESVQEITRWAEFEPNDEILWVRTKRAIRSFLTDMWGAGALIGAVPEDAFSVDIGKETMTKEDIEQGRLVCVIGIAPVNCREFISMRVMRDTGYPQDWG